MHEEYAQLDEELARLAQTLRGGDHIVACLQLAEFALKLDRYIQAEERGFASAYERVERPVDILIAVRREHMSLRRLVAAIANALDAADDRRSLEMVGKLRSVLLLHLAKEERLLAPPTSYAVH